MSIIENPPQCETCLMLFKDKKSLIDHYEIHEKCKLSAKKQFICPFCYSAFISKYTCNRHIKDYCQEIKNKSAKLKTTKLMLKTDISELQQKKSDIITTSKPKNTCGVCGHTFSQKSSLTRHQTQSKQCQLNVVSLSNLALEPQQINSTQSGTHSPDITTLLLEISEMKKQIALLNASNNQQNITINNNNRNTNCNNQVIQIFCENENYLEKLTQIYGSQKLALDFIKNCGLSGLNGDIKLIEKIYFPEGQPPSFQFSNNARTQIEFMNEKHEKVIDTKKVFGGKIANNIITTYLQTSKNYTFESYDQEEWNNHNHNLNKLTYQKNLINSIDIPMNIRK